MEVFSTLQNRAFPWAANTLTVAALALVTWWSAGQRPVAEGGQQLLVQNTTLATSNQSTAPGSVAGVQLASTLGTATPPGLSRVVNAPAQSISREVVQPVSFLPLSKH